MSVKPPCRKNGKDCELRHVGCQATCVEYKEFLARYAREKPPPCDLAKDVLVQGSLRRKQRYNGS